MFAFAFTHITAQCGPNSIVCENQLTGALDSQWDVSGAGDATIQGFATAISVNVGETVHFKVDTDAATFNADIYRMGYYAGRGARKVASITGISGQNQPNCVNNASTGLNDCGNWAETMMWTVPSSAASGIYFAKLTSRDRCNPVSCQELRTVRRQARPSARPRLAPRSRREYQ